MKKLTRHKVAFVFTLITIILLLGATTYLFYYLSLFKDIENVIRLASVIGVGLIVILFVFLMIRFLKKYKKVLLIVFIILSLLLVSAEVFVGYNISKVYSTIKKVTKTDDYITYSASLVTLKTNGINSLDDIGNSKIGIITDETSYEGYIIPNEAIEKNELSNKTESYDGFIALIDALKNGEIDYIFLPTNYAIMFGSIEGYEELDNIMKIVYTQTKKVKKDKIKNVSNKSIKEPFTILLMGVDSETEGIGSSAFNGDSLMVITFNPNTLTSTILSIPRDSYVPIACFNNQKQNKITHAAWRGEDCMQKTIENFLDIKIDYFVKINFKGVVSLVDTLGGIQLDIPYNFCEQNSNRQWGKNTIYVEEGIQILNGEQALAFSRNRHPNPTRCSAKWTNYQSDDFVRGQNQQEVVKALLNKFKSINSLDTVYNLLDTISNNMNTNMTTEQILSLYNVFKDIYSKSSKNSDMADLLGMQKLYLNGYGQRIYDYGGMNLSLYNYVLYDDSIKAVSDAMKINLGLKKAKIIKSFSFNINNPYEEEIIGKDKTSKTSLTLLPNFVGQSLSYVNSFCSAHGIKVNVKYITENGSIGSVINQGVPMGANARDVSSITVNVIQSNPEVKKEPITIENPDKNDPDKENSDKNDPDKENPDLDP